MSYTRIPSHIRSISLFYSLPHYLSIQNRHFLLEKRKRTRHAKCPVPALFLLYSVPPVSGVVVLPGVGVAASDLLGVGVAGVVVSGFGVAEGPMVICPVKAR